jgi:hypothetical protein
MTTGVEFSRLVKLSLCFDASKLRVDFTGALTSGSTAFFPVESFFGIVVAEPLIPHGV